jgi:hypothetical protein
VVWAGGLSGVFSNFRFYELDFGSFPQMSPDPVKQNKQNEAPRDSRRCRLKWKKLKEGANRTRDDMTRHGRMARRGHGLPKVSPGPALPYPSSPCGRATPEMALRPLQRGPARRGARLRPSSSPLVTPRYTPVDMTRRL